MRPALIGRTSADALSLLRCLCTPATRRPQTRRDRDHSSMTSLTSAAVLLAAIVLALPLFRKLGLGSVLGYLAAGIALGPWALKVIDDGEGVLHIAEFGVVMLLFVIGLELQPSRL